MLVPAGCTDNPEAKAAKEMRNQTAQAVQKSVQQKDFDSAQQQTQALLQRNRSQGLTRDAALLAGGNLAVAKGRQLQEDLGLKTLPLHGGLDQLEKVLRKTEGLLVEKERIEMLLGADEKELAELRQWLEGDGQKEGLKQQLTQAEEQMDALLAQKTEVQVEKKLAQSVLGDYQSKADDLLRKAELANGAKRLELEKQAFSILLERKEHYIEVQAAENKIAVFDDNIALVRVRLDGTNKAIDETRQRIEKIINAEPRITLQKQLQEIDTSISANRKQVETIAGELTRGLNDYRQDADRISAVYEEALAELQQVRSGDVATTAILRAADSAYYAAMTCSAYAKIHTDIMERLRNLLDSIDPTWRSFLQSKLPATGGLGTDYKTRIMAYFDQAVEGYETAFQQAVRMGTDARCSIRKSQVLALHSKMQMADVLELFDAANATETVMNALINQSADLGACFTQSEAMRVVSRGLDYMPSLPLNMDVFLERIKQELSEWKSLPVSDQEAAVAENIEQMDELVARYGQEVETQLAPLKQEMIAARERGFKAPETAPGAGFSGFSDPNTY
jgi:hypothetical protein